MKKVNTLAIWLLLAVHCYAQNTPSVSFAKQQYYIEEGQSTKICVTSKNMEDVTDLQDIFIVNNTVNSSFLNFQSKSVPLSNGTFCFQLNSSIADGEINYQNIDILEIQSESEDLLIGPINSTSIILQDDVSSQAPPSLSPILIKGFDNQSSSGESFSLSLITTVPIVSGTSFVVSNSNYSEVQGWLPKISQHEYIQIFWNGNQTIQPGSIICLTTGIDNSDLSLGNEEGLVVLLNGESDGGFETNAFYGNEFLSAANWSNIYLLSSKLNKFGADNVEVYDGITYGIDSSAYPFDIPFLDEAFQLFIGNQTGHLYGFVLCSNLSEICDIIEFIKNINNWTTGTGTEQDELELNDICSDLCEIEFCPNRIIEVNPVCYGESADVIFVLDESGSIVNAGEFDDIKSIVKSTSEALNCLSENVRFAVVAFSSPSSGGYHIIKNFQFGDVNIDSYIPPSSAGTNVSSAYTDLLSDLDNDILDVRAGAELQVILLTDAPHTAYQPYLPFNTLKDFPHNANHTVVYFEDEEPILSTIAAAATASKGEPYDGTIDGNPTDPEGEGGPRRLFVYENIEPNIAESLSILSNCNQIYLSLNPAKEIVNSQLIASDGGEILQQTGEASYITNGKGNYQISVVTAENCTYTGQYSFDTMIDCVNYPESPEDVDETIENRSQSNHLRYEDQTTLISNYVFEAQIMPNPASEFIHIQITASLTDKGSQYRYQIYANDGKMIQQGSWTKASNTLAVKDFGQGLYTIKIENTEGEIIIKKFVVAKF